MPPKESFQVRKVPGHSDFFYKYSLTIFLPIHNASTFWGYGRFFQSEKLHRLVCTEYLFGGKKIRSGHRRVFRKVEDSGMGWFSGFQWDLSRSALNLTVQSFWCLLLPVWNILLSTLPADGLNAVFKWLFASFDDGFLHSRNRAQIKRFLSCSCCNYWHKISPCLERTYFSYV